MYLLWDRHTLAAHTEFNPPTPQKMEAIENDDGTHSHVTYDFTSLTDEESEAAGIEVCTGCVRAANLGSKWTFTTLDGGKKTKIEAEIAVDPKMSNLSSFFVNILQKQWAHASVHGLMRETRRHLGRDAEVQVANTFFRLFPLWN